jgi:hypothetical protein
MWTVLIWIWYIVTLSSPFFMMGLYFYGTHTGNHQYSMNRRDLLWYLLGIFTAGLPVFIRMHM